MSEEQIIKLLGEIRDLQKLHVENYRDALQNQRESIEMQKRALRRNRITIIVLVGLLVVFLSVALWFGK